jgi:hypothetical protein
MDYQTALGYPFTLLTFIIQHALKDHPSFSSALINLALINVWINLDQRMDQPCLDQRVDQP